jgi:hypothetical protein
MLLKTPNSCHRCGGVATENAVIAGEPAKATTLSPNHPACLRAATGQRLQLCQRPIRAQHRVCSYYGQRV